MQLIWTMYCDGSATNTDEMIDLEQTVVIDTACVQKGDAWTCSDLHS